MSKIIIIGAGAMGSAFALPCLDNKHDVDIIGTHLENDFIDPIVSRETSNKCEKLLESTGLKIEEITKKKIKDILGTEYFKKYQNESI